MRMVCRLVIIIGRSRAYKVGVYNAHSMNDVAMGKKGDISIETQEKSQEEYSYADMFFPFIHIVTLRLAKLTIYFE